MKDRIKQYMDYKNISAGELASLLEVQRSNISHILNGRNKPGAAFIEKLLLNFPDLNARWLLTGIGEMVESVPAVEEKEAVKSVQSQHKKKEVEKETATKPIKQIKEDENKTLEFNQAVDRVVLLFKDGTFIDYSKK